MTVAAIAQIIGVNVIPGVPTDVPPVLPSYFVSVSTVAVDTVALTRFVLEVNNIPVLVGVDAKKADQQVREAVAAFILANASLTIDPDDIYFPNP